MFSAFAALLRSKTEEAHPARERLTPGRLYRILAAEFHGERAACRCEMPMLFLRGESADGPTNWGLHRTNSVCKGCSEVIDRMIERYSRRYELTDPYGWTPDDLRIE